MGFFKSVHELHKQAKEIDKDFHPGEMAKDATARMAQVSEMMAQQTRAATAAVNGLDAQATVVAIRQTGAMVNFQPTCEIDLTVLAPGRPPYPVSVTQVVSQVMLPQLQPGASIAVKVDPSDPNTVFIG